MSISQTNFNLKPTLKWDVENGKKVHFPGLVSIMVQVNKNVVYFLLQDFVGQKKAERMFQYIILSFAVSTLQIGSLCSFALYSF